MARSEFLQALSEISELRKLPREVIADALKQALVTAYQRDAHPIKSQKIDAAIDLVTNQHHILVEKEVIDDGGEDQTSIPYERALLIDPNIAVGDMIMVPIEDTIERFGRIAAQTAKQVISQKIRDAEREQLFGEYKEREGELASAQVQSVSSAQITLTIDRAEAVMPRKEMIPGENFKPRDKIRVLIAEVKKSTREPVITVSRAHKNMLRRLLEYEVPEIYQRKIEIKGIAREAGHRSKVAVAALQPGIDPLGACVGERGQRIRAIVEELHGEKIDVIPWHSDPAVFIKKALSPAEVSNVFLEEDIDQGKTALVIVPELQLSLAIGREGQNARLAAKLTGWRIDIKSVSEAAYDLLPQLEHAPLDRYAAEQQELVLEVQRILDKKRSNRVVNNDEFSTLGRFVQTIEQRLIEYREAGRGRRMKAMDKVRSDVPSFAFSIPLNELDLPSRIMDALKNIPNLGDLMLRLKADREMLAAVLHEGKADEDALMIIEEAVEDRVKKEERANAVRPPIYFPSHAAIPAADGSNGDLAVVEAPIAEVPFVLTPIISDEEDGEALPAFVDAEPVKPVEPEKPRYQKVARPTATVTPEPVRDADDPELKGGKKGKGPGQRRELVYDEDRNQVVTKHKHRGGNVAHDWDSNDEI